MEILNISIDQNCEIQVSFDWRFLGVVVLLILILTIIFKFVVPFKIRKIEIDQVLIGTANNKCVLRYNYKDKEIAYKLWVELSTRKVGLDFEKDNDVIVEVYDSWYKFFEITRNLFKELPVTKLQQSQKLIEITETILNKYMRPHLTKYQAKFRRWYANACVEKENSLLSPQEIQSKYPYFDELTEDLQKTINLIKVYKNTLETICFGKKQK